MKHTKQFIVVAWAVLCTASAAFSQSPVPFKVRYRSFVQGDMAVIANSIVNRKDANNTTEIPYHIQTNRAVLNDQFNMEYIDIDNDPSTFSSSSATLSAENQETKKVIYAALYWSSTYKYNTGIQKSENKFVAHDDNREAIEYIKIKLPNQQNYIDIKGEILFDGFGKKDFKDCAPYAVYADITDQINKIETGFGEYTVANIRATEGRLSGGVAAGWTLFVVYRDLTMNGKFITSYDGFTGLTDEFTDINFSGFRTKPEGDVKAKIAFSVLEGDNNLMGDQFFFQSGDNNFSVLETPVRKAKNFLNSSITYDENHFSDRKPDSKNTLGYDSCLLNLKNQDNLLIGNNADKGTLRMKSSGDRCYLFFSAFDVEVIDNEQFVPVKTSEMYVSNAQHMSEFVTEKKSTARQIQLPSAIHMDANEIKSVTIDGFPSGYYIIANVFEKEFNLKNFLTDLKSKGLPADSFLNPKNQYNYVYIAKTDDKSAAVEMCLSKMNNTYNDDVWILSVNKNETVITNLD